MKNYLRIGGYLLFLVLIAILIEWQKGAIRKERTKDVVSILSEQSQKGLPVDLEAVKQKDFRYTYRTTVSLENRQKRLINFYINRQKKNLIQKGQKVFYKPVNEIVGEVISISQKPDLDTGMYKGIIQVNREVKAKDGVRFVEIITKSKKDVISIPAEAASYNEGKSYVWVSTKGKAQRKEVSLGPTESGRAEVLRGLETGDLVVVNGSRYVAEGALLRVRKCESCKEGERK